MNRYIMTCGHTALATTGDGKPTCPICDCLTVKEEEPNLNGRFASCMYCHKKVKSDFGLPFFKYTPELELDTYYCGCEGWN